MPEPRIQWNDLLHLPVAGIVPNHVMEANRAICNVIAESKHPDSVLPYLHNGDLSPVAVGREVGNGELHPPGVEHEKLAVPIHHPVEAAAGVLAPVDDRVS
jgi:hypothetical protein